MENKQYNTILSLNVSFNYQILFLFLNQRYWSITSPLRYLRKRTKKRALVMIGLAWALSSSWLLPVLGWPYFNWQGATPQAGAYSKVRIQYNTAQYSTM